jgi:hypothetical protein
LISKIDRNLSKKLATRVLLLKIFWGFLERVSKIPPERDPEASEIEERVVDGE